MKKSTLGAILLIMPALAVAEGKKTDLPKPEPGQKIVQAARTESPIVLDGVLDETVWKRQPATGFTQTDPVDGQPATEATEVWIAYDDKALYVAAFCRDSEPSKIIRRLGRRDSDVDSDWFIFAVDPYYDRRSGYLFGVNPAGSIIDEALSNDVNDDESWDGIWESKAAVNAGGWTVEMRIPFHQIRFPKQDEYVWGVNFRRVIKRKNEEILFAWTSKKEAAFVSKFARLEGLRGFGPGTHVEIMPYVTGLARYAPEQEGNPFETGHRTLGNAGFDLKASLGGNFTLDATANPDFGQVEVDPAVINLSAYETFYEEKRPFFIEGASIFDGFGRGGIYLNAGMNWPTTMFFYSRRVGRAPQGYATQDGYVDTPDRTTILGAAKLTGKYAGWNIGFINAVTAREYATIDSFGLRTQEEVEPSSYYGVLRAQKDINKGQQGIGFMATGVVRGTDSETLNGILNKNAFTLAVDGWSFLDAKRNYVVGGWFGATSVEGTAADIYRLQTSSYHYYQRPDASYLSLDPGATSLSGWGGRFQIAKQGGNFLWVVGAGALSPGFDINDAGYQSRGSDITNYSFLAANQWTKPGKVFQYFLLGGGGLLTYDFGGNKTGEALVALVQGTFPNFWSFNSEWMLAARTYDTRLTRGGPLAVAPWSWSQQTSLETDSRRPFVLEVAGSYSGIPEDGYAWSAEASLTWKPRPNFSLSMGPEYMVQTTDTQWVGRFSDELMTETYGRRYVFAHLDQTVVAAEIRLNWTFTPKLSLQAYLQPFIGVGHFDGFRELAAPKTFDFNVYGEGGSTVDYADGVYTVDPDGAGSAAAFSFGDPDFNMKSLRGTIVLRWEYLPGSLFYLVWTQNRADYADAGTLNLSRDTASLFTAPGDNVFMFKLSYRWGA
ncbi:MAG: DUF5916 domain-containing protein [Acidobacteriota bacterium]|nr:DUF5916 domain-containing protein [Acidobacteriota bacterium]